MDDWPTVSPAFVRYLQRKYPDVTPMRASSLLELGQAQGRREVVQFIENLQKAQRRGAVLD